MNAQQLRKGDWPPESTDYILVASERHVILVMPMRHMTQGQNALGIERGLDGTLLGMPKKAKEVARDPAASEMQRLAGQRIRVIRELAGGIQTDVCKAIGVEQSTWSKWESGARMPDTYAMTRFAARAKTTLDFIFRGELAGTHPALARLVLLKAPDLVRKAPTDTDQGTDMALASYRSSIDLTGQR